MRACLTPSAVPLTCEAICGSVDRLCELPLLAASAKMPVLFEASERWHHVWTFALNGASQFELRLRNTLLLYSGGVYRAEHASIVTATLAKTFRLG